MSVEALIEMGCCEDCDQDVCACMNKDECYYDAKRDKEIKEKKEVENLSEDLKMVVSYYHLSALEKVMLGCDRDTEVDTEMTAQQLHDMHYRKEEDVAKEILDEVAKHYGGKWLVDLYRKYNVKEGE